MNFILKTATFTLLAMGCGQSTRAADIDLTAKLDQTAVVRGSNDDHFVIVEITAPHETSGPRALADVALVIDTSGSMSGDKIVQARAAAREVVEALGAEDRLSVVRFSSQSTVAVPLTASTRSDRALVAIEGLQATGGTNLYDGLRKGIGTLSASASRVNRVVLLSDGHPDSAAGLVEMARAAIESGTTISTVGLGLGVNAELLYDIGYAGGGTYNFVDQPGQLAQLFATEFNRITHVAARSVEVEVAVAPGVEVLEVYGYHTTITDAGYTAQVGDLHAGQTKKLIARVRLPTAAAGLRDVADVRAQYTNVSSPGVGKLRDDLDVHITDDLAAARASVDEDILLKGVGAEIAAMRYQANQQWAEGKAEEAVAQFEAAADRASKRAASSGSAALAALAKDVVVEQRAVQTVAPGSVDAQLQTMEALEALGYLTH